MKKYLSLLIALVMVLSMAVTAFAEEFTTSAGGSASQDVEAGYVAPVDIDGGKVYRIVIEWEPVVNDEDPLRYVGKDSTYTWSTTDLVYEETVNDEGWHGAAGYKVTVTNYSNDEVTAATSATNTYKLTLDEPEDEEATLKSAAEGILYTETSKKGVATVAEFTYTYFADGATGATAPAVEDVTEGKVSVGKITVNITVG